jgi:hypothetical protein
LISSVWPGDCPVTQPYGCTTLTVEPYYPPCSTRHKHCGVDIGMVVNTPLYAARAGMVINITYGLVGVQVGPETDWYVHVDRAAPQLRFGQPVAKGELTAYSGNKVPAGGSLTGPHLHFETQAGRLNNPQTAIDPVPILTGGYPVGTIGEATDLVPSITRWISDTRQAQALELGSNSTTAIPVSLPQLMAEIKAIPAANNAAVLTAINSLAVQVSQVQADVAYIKNKLDQHFK